MDTELLLDPMVFFGLPETWEGCRIRVVRPLRLPPHSDSRTVEFDDNSPVKFTGKEPAFAELSGIHTGRDVTFVTALTTSENEKTWDPCLLPFLNAPTDAAAQKELDTLFAIDGPVLKAIRQAVTKQTAQDRDDLEQMARIKLFEHLRLCRKKLANPGDTAPTPIQSLRIYAFQMGQRQFSESLRKENPTRARLRDGLWDQFRAVTPVKEKEAQTERAQSAQLEWVRWQAPDKLWWCGRANWSDTPISAWPIRRMVLLQSNPGAFAARHVAHDRYLTGGPNSPQIRYGAFVRDLLDWLKQPIPFPILLNVAVDLLEIQDRAPVSLDAPLHASSADDDRTLGGSLAADEETSDPLARLLKEEPPASLQQMRELLRRYWQEITALLPRHRLAYLLNWRESKETAEAEAVRDSYTETSETETVERPDRNMLAAWIEAGLLSESDLESLLRRTFAEIEIPWEHFAPYRNQLPLADLVIAEILGESRQRIIDFRRKARQKLGRRFRAEQEHWLGGPAGAASDDSAEEQERMSKRRNDHD